MSLSGSRGLSNLTGRSYRGSEAFPDPFFDVASMHMPEDIGTALRWCEFLISSNGAYRQAINRVISYFITDVELEGDDREERDKFKEFLDDTLGIKRVLKEIALDFATYGNSFTSVLVPIQRYLYCPQCKIEFTLRKVATEPIFNFRWEIPKFLATCPKCHYSGPWKRNDRRAVEETDIKIKRWPVDEIELLWDPLTDDVSYIWKIPNEYRQMLRKNTGNLFQLERANWEVIQAVANDQVLRFDDDVIFHMKEETLCGIRNRGWGISRVLANFRQAWYVQVLHRYNEAIALDYVVPFRVITPEPRRGAGPEMMDPALTQNLGNFSGRIRSMLRHRRQDPARWNVLPFPIQYQALGGDATQLAPTELLEQGLDSLFTSIGIPVEFYKGTMTLQTAPASLRLFESNWSPLVYNMNQFLQWLVGQVSQIMSWEPLDAKLMRVTHADDLDRKLAKLQLMTNRQISQTSGLKSMGLDFEQETRQQLEEDRFVAEETQKMQEDLAQAQQMDAMAGGPMAGAPAAGGAPAGPAGPMQPGAAGAPAQPAGQPGQQPADPAAAGGAAAQFGAQNLMPQTVPQTPEEMMAQAETIAHQLLGLPETQRKSELIQLKRTNPTVHALVESIMEQIRQNARSQGGAQVLQQTYGAA